MSIAQRVAVGTFWLAGAQWFNRISGIVGSVVLARLLSPQDYGVVAIAASVLALAQGLSNVQSFGNLVRVEELSRAHMDTAFTIAFVRGCCVSLVVAGTATVTANALGVPELTSVLLVMALLPLMDSIQNPKFVVYARELSFGLRAGRDVAAGLTSLAVAIPLAYMWRDYRAIVAAGIASALVMLVSGYALAPYRPRLSVEKLREHFSFSTWVWLSGIVSTLGYRVDALILGRYLDVSMVGVYTMARDVAAVPADQALQPVSATLFPALSLAHREGRDTKGVALEAMGVIASIGIPLCVGVALVSHELVLAILGERWAGVAPILEILLPVLGALSCFYVVRSLLYAMGKTQAVFWADALYMVVRLSLFLGGLALYGMIGGVCGIAIAGVMNIAIQQVLLWRECGIGAIEVLGATWRALLSASCMAGVVLMVDSAFSEELGRLGTAGILLALATKSGAGALTYVLGLLFLWRVSGSPARGIEFRMVEVLMRLRGSQ